MTLDMIPCENRTPARHDATVRIETGDPALPGSATTRFVCDKHLKAWRKRTGVIRVRSEQLITPEMIAEWKAAREAERARMAAQAEAIDARARALNAKPEGTYEVVRTEGQPAAIWWQYEPGKPEPKERFGDVTYTIYRAEQPIEQRDRWGIGQVSIRAPRTQPSGWQEKATVNLSGSGIGNALGLDRVIAETVLKAVAEAEAMNREITL